MSATGGPSLNRSWNTGEPSGGVGARGIRLWPHSRELNARARAGSVTVRQCPAPQIRSSPGRISFADAVAQAIRLRAERSAKNLIALSTPEPARGFHSTSRKALLDSVRIHPYSDRQVLAGEGER